MVRRYPRRQSDLLGVGEGLAGERLAAEQTPPAFLQIEPAGARGDGHRAHAWMLPQPLLDGRAGVAGEVVADEIEVPVGIGRLQQREELEIANRVARGSVREGAVKVSSRPSRTRSAP
jgi:hypothetical protein